MGFSVPSRVLAAAVVILGSASPFAAAGTLKVPSQFPTIQAAVTAAIPGDTVLVSGGTYFEAVDISAGKDALTLRGKGKVVIDASPGGTASGAGISIASTQVTIENVTVRHAQTAGDVGNGIRSTSLGTTIVDVTVQNCARAGIDLTSDDAVVQNVTIVGCNGGLTINGDRADVRDVTVTGDSSDGIRVDGLDPSVVKCAVQTVDGDGINVVGDNAVVRKCDVDNADGVGIGVEGDLVNLTKNDVRNTGDNGIQVDGDEALVEKNQVTAAGGDGVSLAGDDGTVTKNTITGSADRGVLTDGLANTVTDNTILDAAQGGIRVIGDGSSAIGNTVENAAGDAGVAGEGADVILDQNKITGVRGGPGVELVDSASGGVISFNEIRNASGSAIGFSNADGVQVFSNDINRCGLDGVPGILVDGDSIQLSNNRVRNCADDGIRVTGDNCTVNNNDVRDNLVDGIDVSGSSNSLNGNTVRGNLGEGIENSGTATDLLNNVGEGNRIDFATDGSEGVFFSNSFETGGQTTAPEID